MIDVMQKFSLEGKTALVTGACYGIGFAIATALHGAGAKIAFCATSDASVEKALKAYEAEGITDVKGYACDVTDEPRARELVARVEQDVGPIDILVNNAGIIKRIPMCDMAVEDFRRVVDVDLVAPFIMAKAVLPGMVERGHGKIINICSLMSELGRETVSAYAAAKGGLKMLTRISARNSAAATFSATASAPATSPRSRPRLCGRSSPTAASSLRPLHRGPHAGRPLGRSRGSDGSGHLPGLRRLQLRQRPRALCGRRRAGLHRQAALSPHCFRGTVQIRLIAFCILIETAF